MDGYKLTRRWFDFAFENSDCKVQHTAIYLWAVELNNRLGWKKEFGLPTGATMEGLSIGDKRTYLSALRSLQEWGFIIIVKEAKNQFQSCIIEICHSEITPALPTALDTALSRHNTSNNNDTTTGTTHGGTPIDKPLNNETFKPLNNETDVDADRVEAEEVFEEPVLKEKKETPPKVAPKGSPTLHAELKQVIEELNPGYYWQAKDGKALKSIIAKIQFRWNNKHGTEATDENVITSFSWLMKNLPDWYRDKWDTSTIDSKFESIVKQITEGGNGKSKQGAANNTSPINTDRFSKVLELINERSEERRQRANLEKADQVPV